jgi:peptide/nickel transport system permease protein
MVVYAVRRLLQAIPLLIVASIIAFLMVSNIGNPLANLEAEQPPVPPEYIASERQRLRLNQPLVEQYWHWVTGIFHGDWGPSVDRIDIGQQLWSGLLVSIKLVLFAMILALILALVVGVISAVKKYSLTDSIFTFIAFLFLSMPVFWLAILLKQQAINLNESLGTTLLDTIGNQSIPPPVGLWNNFGDFVRHIVLPTLVLAMTTFGAWSRYVRSSMIEVGQSDYVRLARAKGLSRRRVLLRHELRTALIPLTTVVALELATLFSGAVITETVFQWRGMGYFIVTAVTNHDMYAVLDYLMVVAVIVIAFNLLADLAYAALDPRIRLA